MGQLNATPAETFRPEVQAEIDRRVKAGMSQRIAEDWAQSDERRGRLERALRAAWSETVRARSAGPGGRGALSDRCRAFLWCGFAG